MSRLFLKILNMSLSAGWLVLAVLLLRQLLKKAPKWVNVLLWGLVAVRLVFPFSIQSALSLLPSGETIPQTITTDRAPAIHSGIDFIDQQVNPVIAQSNLPAPGASINPLQVTVSILTGVWLAGMAALALYTALSYWRIRRQVLTAVRLRENIYQSENAASPFVLGLIRPRIYLPFAMSDSDREHVIAHEQAHIERGDHWWKPLGFALLTVHWFNPLLWLSYILLCRDIELACDEKVIGQLERGRRADYTQALLSCSISSRSIVACPLAFGEVGVKTRVRSVLRYRKPAFWVVALSVAVCAAAAVGFLTDPPTAHAAPQPPVMAGPAPVSPAPALPEQFPTQTEADAEQPLPPVTMPALSPTEAPAAPTTEPASEAPSQPVSETPAPPVTELPQWLQTFHLAAVERSPVPGAAAAPDALVTCLPGNGDSDAMGQVLRADRWETAPIPDHSDGLIYSDWYDAPWLVLHDDQGNRIMLAQEGSSCLVMCAGIQNGYRQEWHYTAPKKVLEEAVLLAQSMALPQPADTGLAARMASLTAGDITALVCGSPSGGPVPTAAQAAEALNRAAASPVTAPADLRHYYDLKLYLDPPPTNYQSAYYGLAAGSRENIVYVRLMDDSQVVGEGYFESEALYRYIRSGYPALRDVDQSAYAKYSDLLHDRAKQILRASQEDPAGALTDHEITTMRLYHSFSAEDSRYDVYAWGAAYTPQNIHDYTFSYNGWMTAEGTVQGQDPTPWLVICTDSAGAESHRFLDEMLFREGAEADRVSIAEGRILQTFADTAQ